MVSHFGREGKCSVTFGTSVVSDLLGWEEAAVANACHWSICEQGVLGSKHPALCTRPQSHYLLSPVFDTGQRVIFSFFLVFPVC